MKTNESPKTAAQKSSAASSTKRYRSMNEIRRAFYPQASKARGATVGSRTKNSFFSGQSANVDGSL